MQWEYMTASMLADAVKDPGVCIFTMGVLEQHGEHLPLGTDYLVVHRLASLAAEREPAVVFPPFYFGQINEARAFPGAVALAPDKLVTMIRDVLDEIARNGFKKIILVNWHGGNNYMVAYLAQCCLYEKKPYTLYVYKAELSEERRSEWNSILDTKLHGHACECETCMVMADYAEYVRMQDLPEVPGDPQHRLSDLPGAFTGIWWYGDYPEHYAGDARTASVEKGKRLQELLVQNLAEFIRDVKKNTSVQAMEEEFFARERKLRA